jgi:hypothetical protein
MGISMSDELWKEPNISKQLFGNQQFSCSLDGKEIWPLQYYQQKGAEQLLTCL